MNTMTETIGTNTYTIAHYPNGHECYELVKDASEKYWQGAAKTDSIENYRFDADAKPWSLGPMLQNNGFELGYSVLSINDKPWAFAGIRKYSDDIAIVLARLFCFFTVKPVCYGLLLPFHLSVAKEQGYKKAWTSLNHYNTHLYETWSVKEFDKKIKHKRTNIMYENNDKMIANSKFLGEVTLYNTKQNVIEWEL
jgi:hypothetical protein